jgi:triosephosphate isomerase
MLKGLAEYVIVGHSERRHFEHESDKRIAKKVAAALRNQLRPILCVGEKLDDREEGHAKRVVVDQLHGNLSQIASGDLSKLLIAYEPIWAIGTGKSATPDQVAPMVSAIRETIEELFGEAASAQVEILYGGSANPDNARSFLEMENINGLLPGGASLNYEQFAAMIDTAAQLSNDR